MRRAIRVGTCVAGAAPAAGTAVLAAAAVAEDGASAALGARPGSRLAADPGLREALAATAGLPEVTVVSRDVGPAHGGPPPALGPDEVLDLQTAATFAFCRDRGLAAAAVLAVATSGGRRLEDEPLEAVLLGLADAAVAALAANAKV
jgi:hypothetical protein